MTQSWPACWAFQLKFVRALLIRLKAACPIDLPLLSPLRLNDYELALKFAATRTRLTASKISPHCDRHGGASAAAFKLLLGLPGIQKRGRVLGANSVRRYEKLANWRYSVPPPSTMQVMIHEALFGSEVTLQRFQ